MFCANLGFAQNTYMYMSTIKSAHAGMCVVKKRTMSVCETQRMKCSAWYTCLQCTQCSQHTLIRTHEHVGISAQSANLSNLQMGQASLSRLQTGQPVCKWACPVCKRDIDRWDGPICQSAQFANGTLTDGPGPSVNLSNL